MKTFGLIVAGILGFITIMVILGALGLGGRWVNMKVEAWFAPREAEIQRNVFEETKSFNEGKEQELVKYRLEYMRGDDVDKQAIAAAVRHAFADYDDSRLSPELRNFVEDCKSGGF
jgi:hypothetical protein